MSTETKTPAIDDANVSDSITSIVEWLNLQPQGLFFLRRMGEQCADKLLLQCYCTDGRALKHLRKLTDVMIQIEREMHDNPPEVASP